MKSSLKWPVWLWAMQAVTGGLLVIYIVIHTIDNGMILLGQHEYEKMLAFWHETLPHWFYFLMVIGLVSVFVLHMLNGIRVASKPYKEIDVSWRHNVMLKHQGTMFWYAQVISGSAIAMFGVWHLIVQHGGEGTTTAAQSAMRVTPIVFTMYVLFMLAVMFHSFNGVRSVLLKLGLMTDKAKEGLLIGIMAFFFIVFFFVGVLSMAKFLPPPIEATLLPQCEAGHVCDGNCSDGPHEQPSGTSSGELGESNRARPVHDFPIMSGDPIGGDGSGNPPDVDATEEAGIDGGGDGE